MNPTQSNDSDVGGTKCMSERLPVVFLVDVGDTLLDNDHIQNDLQERLEREFGAACRDRYWKILEALFEELGYRDYLGALQRYRIEHPTDIRLLGMSSYLVDYPFADRLYPGARDFLNRLRSWGPDRDTFGRGCGLSTARGRALGTRRSRLKACAHLHSQGRG